MHVFLVQVLAHESEKVVPTRPPEPLQPPMTAAERRRAGGDLGGLLRKGSFAGPGSPGGERPDKKKKKKKKNLESKKSFSEQLIGRTFSFSLGGGGGDDDDEPQKRGGGGAGGGDDEDDDLSDWDEDGASNVDGGGSGGDERFDIGSSLRDSLGVFGMNKSDHNAARGGTEDSIGSNWD